MAPAEPKPRIMSAQVEGSGTSFPPPPQTRSGQYSVWKRVYPYFVEVKNDWIEVTGLSKLNT